MLASTSRPVGIVKGLLPLLPVLSSSQGSAEGYPYRDADGYPDEGPDPGTHRHAGNNHAEHGSNKGAYPHSDKLPGLHTPAFPFPTGAPSL